MLKLKQVQLFSLAMPFAIAMGFIGFIVALVYVVGGIIEDIFIAGRVKLWSDWINSISLYRLRRYTRTLHRAL